MSDIADDLRAVVRTIVQSAERGSSSGPQWKRVWSELQTAGITQIAGRDAGSEGGDLDDLVACVQELAAAAVSTPLIEHATAGWAAPNSLETDAVLDTVAVGTTHLSVSDQLMSGSVRARWAAEAKHLVLVLPDGLVFGSG
ncbi:hypothetical protein [Leekyejoonella antrihumi]|uniref:Acyl-CoA dehydrogenase n=1 Tax=Leekyejoonella antrihumi TaxID=1660198 RepID=A0A563DWC5_9MICO|nr:hypothetical protein [Leekyejoonella antrihumi]TWP34588.1 hypothetical protein FGL98_16975 [Leekyejoonella antrihumi]